MRLPRYRATKSRHGALRVLNAALERFTDTRPANLPARMNALQKRRAKNRRARRSRKENR